MTSRITKEMKAKIILSVFALGVTLCIAQPADAKTITVNSWGDVVTKMQWDKSQYDDPAHALDYYVQGTNNVLNLNITLDNTKSFYASPLGGGNGHTTNYTGRNVFAVFGGEGSNNTLNITGNAYTGYAYGGETRYGKKDISGNRMYVKGGNFSAGTTLGGGRATGSANNNMLVVSSGIFEPADAAPVALTDDLPEDISSDSKSGKTLLWGGEACKDANGNTVDVSGFTGNISQIMGGSADDGSASNNVVMLGKGNGAYTGLIKGGSAYGSNATANNNSVQILGGTFNCYITGGSASSSKGTANANKNTIEVRDGIFNGLKMYGGGASSNTKMGYASDNLIVIQDGKFLGTAGVIVGGYAPDGQAMRNRVVINGGDFQGTASIYAGDTGMKGVEKSNVIELYGGKLDKVTLYGTRYKWGADQLKDANPILNVYGSGIKVNNISNFAKVNYYLPDSVSNETVILEALDKSATMLTNTKVNVATAGGTNLKPGDRVYLLTNRQGKIWEPESATGTVTEGVSIEYDLDITLEEGDTALVGTVMDGTYGGGGGSGVHLKDDTKSLVETRSAAMATLNNSIDMVTDKGFAAARDAARAETAGGFAPFIYAGANSMRYQTGSHVDSHGWGLAAGFAKEFKGKYHTLITGPFVEHGRSSYDSYLDDGVKADGKNKYTGGGWFVRNELKNGVSYEASVRFGHMNSDYNGRIGLATSYDSSSNYLGFHAGVGKTFGVGKKDDSLEVYGKYFYTHQNGTNATLSTGERYHFDAVNSSRIRLGARYTHPVKNTLLYAGLAWDYEFDSDARATYRGYSTPSPSMKGSSGMLELGVRYRPSPRAPFHMDLSLAGWAGKQRGVSFNAAFQWTF